MNDTDVTAVVLAAGEGRRLEPLTNRRPKPMVPVANRPILEYVVSAIADAGIDRVVLVVGYQQERIRNHFGDGDDWGLDIEYVVQATQLGTAHAVLQAEDAVTGPFLVLNGDRLVDASLIADVQRVLEQLGEPVMAVTRTDDASDYGVVSLDGDQVTTITEKPHDPAPTELINAGVYGFAPSIFTAIRDTPTERGELALPTTLERIAADQPIQAVRYQGTWLDVSHLWDLLDVNAAMIDAAEDRDQPALDGAIASDTAIGDDVVLGPNATVEGGTALGANVTVEANAVLANAVVFPDAVIEAGAVVRDAIIASNVRIGANTTIAGGATTVVVEGEVHDDVTLGGVVGDNATVGSGVTVDPGSVIGDGATVAHGASVDGRIEPDAVVRRG